VQIVARLARNRDAPRSRRVLVLLMASMLLDKAPPIPFDQPNHLAPSWPLRYQSYACSNTQCKNPGRRPGPNRENRSYRHNKHRPPPSRTRRWLRDGYQGITKLRRYLWTPEDIEGLCSDAANVEWLFLRAQKPFIRINRPVRILFGEPSIPLRPGLDCG